MIFPTDTLINNYKFLDKIHNNENSNKNSNKNINNTLAPIFQLTFLRPPLLLSSPANPISSMRLGAATFLWLAITSRLNPAA